MVTADAIGADGTLRKLAVLTAQALGSNATLDTVTLHASHSHRLVYWCSSICAPL